MIAAPGAPSIRRVVPVMGTMVGIIVHESLVPPGVLDAVFDQLRAVEARFSMFRPDSEISRLARGEIRQDEWAPMSAMCCRPASTSPG